MDRASPHLPDVRQVLGKRTEAGLAGEMVALAEAVERFKKRVEVYNGVVEKVGSEILVEAIERFGPGKAFGVPPEGEWSPEHHRDAALSSYGDDLMALQTVRFGIAVQAPGADNMWSRIVVVFMATGDNITVALGEGMGVDVDKSDTRKTANAIVDEIVEYLTQYFDGGLDTSEVGKRGIGFGIF